MNDYHFIQTDILKKLLFSRNLNYSKLKPVEIESSQFAFHLESLIKEKLVKKDAKGIYSLTSKGKLVANSIDFDSKTPDKQAKLSVVFCCKKKDQILIYKRLKNPFYGCEGFPTGKVQYGESIFDAAKRELKEETNLTGKPKLLAIRHYKVFEKTSDELLEDKVMYIFLIKNPSGELKSNSEGEFRWIAINGLLDNPLEEFEEIRLILERPKLELDFKEVNHFTSNF